jgi:lysophospholipase L1-like esterase
MAYRRQLRGDFERSISDHPSWPLVISEGDSWFSYSDVIGRLDDPRGTAAPKDQRPWALLRLEKAGDEILTILSGAQRAKLRGYFKRWNLDALLFSGGGNDVIGPDLEPLLLDFAAGAAAADLVRRPRFERRLRQVQDGYRELLDLLSDAGRTCKVFVNSYGYVVPSKKGAELAGIFKVSGPWVLPAFDSRGIPRALFGDLVKILIDEFARAIDEVASEPASGGRLVRVETRTSVGSDWMDEIHPNPKGARRVANAFEAALRSAGVIT